jgi:hypothetical protein
MKLKEIIKCLDTHVLLAIKMQNVKVY